MGMFTYKDIIHKYAADVLSGHADTDLTKRQRHFVGVLLNISTGLTGYSYGQYPPSPETRTKVVSKLVDTSWDFGAGALFIGKEREDYDIALTRAVEILTNI
jgi:hypothetical protein